jgi:hypothetical protein
MPTSLSDWPLVEQTGVVKMQGRLFLADDRHASLPIQARIRDGVRHRARANCRVSAPNWRDRSGPSCDV